MSYVGGLGAGRGWHKCQFLVDPDILHEILTAQNACLVITNSRVPVDYEVTPVDEYAAAYRRYLGAMLGSGEAATRAARDIYMGIANSLDLFAPQKCPDDRFKLMNPQKPVVNLGPLMLDYDGVHLRMNVLSDVHLGLELSFPKVISLPDDRHEVLHDTSGYATYAIFDNLKSRIKQATIPCRIRSPSRVHRTPVRISEGMRPKMREHPGLRALKLEII